MRSTAPMTRRRFLAWAAAGSVGSAFAAKGVHAAAADDPLAPWRAAVRVRPIGERLERHTIHSYYLTRPESPDGAHVLFYASGRPDGHLGYLVVLDRATGKETVIARNIETEDAHRAACQQWIGKGKRVAYHAVKDGRWSVHVLDLESGADRTLAEDRQVCFGPATGDVVPVCGCHWKPGAHRGLELLNTRTGAIAPALTIADVEKGYGDWLTKEFGGKPTSIYFPNLSPDGLRAFFKMAAPGKDGAADNFRSKEASHRQGLFVYDLAAKRPLMMREKWGHPAWHPDSRRIVEMGNILLDVENDGKVSRMPDLPNLRGNHPSMSPDGRLFVMDGLLDNIGGPAGHWGVVVCDVRGGQFQVLHRFDNSRGARSWRKNHPHPVFSPDGRRIHFNVNEGDWTQLLVAEAGAGK